jgi:hypothetical protein
VLVRNFTSVIRHGFLSFQSTGIAATMPTASFPRVVDVPQNSQCAVHRQRFASCLASTENALWIS